MFIGACTCEGYLKCQRVLVSVTSVFGIRPSVRILALPFMS